LIVSNLPELVGTSDDFVTRNRTYLTALFVLIPLFCLYVLQTTAHSRKLRAQLIENQTKDDFVAIVSHELRTPLADEYRASRYPDPAVGLCFSIPKAPMMVNRQD
jgi:hypothetical protein